MMEGIVVVVSIAVDTEHRVEQRKEVADQRAVGKLPQAVHKALVKTIHNPHLVYCHKRLVEEEMVKHSARL
jgi:endonuclease III